MILIAQVLYYRRYPYRKRRRSSHSPGASHLSPATPLLNPNKPPKRPPPISTAKAGKTISIKAKSSINQFFCCSRSCSVRNTGVITYPVYIVPQSRMILQKTSKSRFQRSDKSLVGDVLYSTLALEFLKSSRILEESQQKV